MNRLVSLPFFLIVGFLALLAASADVVPPPAGPVEVATVADGNPPPHRFEASGITVDLKVSSGGTLRAHTVPEAPSAEELTVLPRYWEVSTDMPVGSFRGTIQIEYDRLEVPEGITESQLELRYFDPADGEWKLLSTALDPESTTASASFERSPLRVLLGVSSTAPAPPPPPGNLTMK